MKMRKKSEILDKAIQLDDEGWVHRHYMYRLKEEDPEKVEADFGSTSVEKKYGKSIAEWQKVISDCGIEKHMQIVGYLKEEHGLGHGHANALVAWTLAGNVAAS
jgi:hypothetical protein